MEDNTQPLSQPSTASTSAMPSTWPGAWGLYKYSKQAVMTNIGVLILLFVMSFASGLLGVIPVLGQIASYVVGVVVSVASILVLSAGIKGNKMSVGESLAASLTVKSVKYFVNIILLTFILIGSLLLFIIPFFFIFPRVALAPYFVALDDMGPIEAISASWNATKGHVGKIYGIAGVSLVFALLCIVLIGIYFSIMYAAAFVILFAFIKGQTANPVESASPLGNPTTPDNASPVAPTASPAPETQAPQTVSPSPQPTQPQSTSPEQTPPTAQ